MNIRPVVHNKSALILVLILMASMALAACGTKKTIIMEPQEPEQVQPQFPVVPHIDEARALWDAGDTVLAGQYFYSIATAPDNAIMKSSATMRGQAIGRSQRAEAWQYYAMACIGQDKAQEALKALDKSLVLNPLADQSATWQETWFAAASQVDDTTAMNLARAIYPDQNRPWSLRAQAGLLFAMKQMAGPSVAPANLQSSVQLLSEIYGSASPIWRASLEQQLYDVLPTLAPTTLTALRGMVHAGNVGQFPYNVIQLEYVGAMLAGTSGSTGGNLSSAILQLQQQAYFENTQLMNVILGGDTSPATCLVLALPMSGTYAPIGLKVARGASAAQWQMSNNGDNIDLHIINTESASWIAEISALPSQCTTIGGPLRMNKYAEIKASGLTKKRAFFTFMSQLEQSASSTDEGTVAWRFFSSSQDQMTALLNFSTSLGINQYGILAPDEPYGQRMSALFTKEVTKLGGTVETVTYPPKTPAQWNGIVRNFVKRRTVNDTPIPTATFQAVFLPDSWGNMEMLVPNLFYHGEDRQVLLGTAIWAQGLIDGNNSVNNFALATFPNSWNPNAESPLALALNDFLLQSGQDQADTWVGLGFDFVRFATALGVPQDWTADALNAMLAKPSMNMLSFNWSMAPITWTAQGIASQQLFLFAPTVDGYEIVNEQDFAKRLNTTRQRHARRSGAAKSQ